MKSNSNCDIAAKFFKGLLPEEKPQVCIGEVIVPPPKLTINILDSEVILYPYMLYMNDRLFDDYTREYSLIGEIGSITINATSFNKPCGKGNSNPHGTISGSGNFSSKGTIINTCTLKVGDLVKVTPTENGQKWIVDCKIRKISDD